MTPSPLLLFFQKDTKWFLLILILFFNKLAKLFFATSFCEVASWLLMNRFLIVSFEQIVLIRRTRSVFQKEDILCSFASNKCVTGQTASCSFLFSAFLCLFSRRIFETLNFFPPCQLRMCGCQVMLKVGGNNLHCAIKENVEWRLKHFMPQVCARRVNELDGLMLATIMLDINQIWHGIQLPCKTFCLFL